MKRNQIFTKRITLHQNSKSSSNNAFRKIFGSKRVIQVFSVIVFVSIICYSQTAASLRSLKASSLSSSDLVIQRNADQQSQLNSETSKSTRDDTKPTIITTSKDIDEKQLPPMIEFADRVGDANDETGSKVNCIPTSDANSHERNPLLSDGQSHPEEGWTTVSCQSLYYRVRGATFEESDGKVVVGVLSGAGGEGPSRRQSIRDTWADGRHGIYFLVAGPWENIKDEYETHGDLLWIEEEEFYNKEKSVLTYKTLSFISIMEDLSKKYNKQFLFAFKTDDDSYLHIENLYKELFEKPHEPYHYWGWCQRRRFKPLRDEANKWSVSYATYPESVYPRYCQGAGFALSKSFIETAVNGHHIENARFMPFEDVAVGIIAERSGVLPTMIEDQETFKMYRVGSSDERNRVNHDLPKIDRSKLTKPDMREIVLQHRIYDVEDMIEHHKSVVDPDYFKN